MRGHLFLAGLLMSIAQLGKAQINDSTKVLFSPVFSNMDAGIKFPPVTSGTQMEVLYYGELFAVNTWYFSESKLGFQFSPGVMIYDSEDPVYSNFWAQHIPGSWEAYKASFYGNRATISLKAGPTYKLLDFAGVQLHGFGLLAVNVRRWRIPKYLATENKIDPLGGVFEHSDIYNDLYYSSARLTSPFYHFRVGMTSLFELNKSPCSFAVWLELHPPRAFRYELQEISSHHGLYELEFHNSQPHLLIGAGLKFHDFTGQNFIKNAF